MDKRKVLIDYTIIFNPDQAWTSLSAFESDLANFFAAHGFECNVIKTIEGQLGRRLLELVRIDPVSAETNFHNQPKQVGRPPSFKTVLNRKRDIREVRAPEKNFKDGKFLPSKGYIKR